MGKVGEKIKTKDERCRVTIGDKLLLQGKDNARIRQTTGPRYGIGS